MDFKLLPIEEADLPIFKHDMQEAFQLGAAAWEESLDEEILPESHINKSLSAEGAIAYKAVVEGALVGGAIVVIQGEHGHLDFLYVKSGTQSSGIGQKIWNRIEEMHPEVTLWETCTPYFDTRNLHFYINRCGFAAVEFYNPKHMDPNAPEGEDGSDLFFRFEKRITCEERIAKMEAILDRATAALDAVEQKSDEYERLQDDIRILDAYYSSESWKRDLALDEQGKLPRDLKRGVLSEDAIYNLLERNRELLEQMGER